MANSLTGLRGNFGTGIAQNSLVEQRPFDNYIVIPLASSASATVPASLVTQQTISLWNNYTLTRTPNVWAVTFPNTTTYLGDGICVLDCLRNALLTFSTASTVATVVTIDGYDDQGVEVVWTSGTISTGTTTVSSTKCFKLIKNVTFTAAPWSSGLTTNTVTVRGGVLFGLPYYINTTDSVTSAYWGTTSVIANIISGPLWRQTTPTPPVASTTIPLATSTDARGYVNLTSNTAPNGVIVLSVNYYVYGADAGINQQLKFLTPNQYGASSTVFSFANQPGSSRAIARINNSNTTGKPVLPSLVSQDQFGAQYPGDNTFMIYYNDLLAL